MVAASLEDAGDIESPSTSTVFRIRACWTKENSPHPLWLFHNGGLNPIRNEKTTNPPGYTNLSAIESSSIRLRMENRRNLSGPAETESAFRSNVGPKSSLLSTDEAFYSPSPNKAVQLYPEGNLTYVCFSPPTIII